MNQRNSLSAIIASKDVLPDGLLGVSLRRLSLVIPALFPPSRGENKATWFMDYFSGEFGQLGTQFDALGHAGTKLKMADGSEKDRQTS